jgi:hypothetical protein
MERPSPTYDEVELPSTLNFQDPFIKEVFMTMTRLRFEGHLEESCNLRLQLAMYLETPDQKKVHEDLQKRTDEELARRSTKFRSYYRPINPYLPPTSNSAPISTYPTAWVSPNLTPSTSARPEPNPYGSKDFPIFVSDLPLVDELPSLGRQDSDTQFILNQDPTPLILSDDEAQRNPLPAPKPVAEPVPEPVLEPVQFPAPEPTPTLSEPSPILSEPSPTLSEPSEQPPPTYTYPFSEPTPRPAEPKTFRPRNDIAANPALEQALFAKSKLPPPPPPKNLFASCTTKEHPSWRDKEEILEFFLTGQPSKVYEMQAIQPIKTFEHVKGDGSPGDTALALYFVLKQSRPFCPEESDLRTTLMEFLSNNVEYLLWMEDIIQQYQHNIAQCVTLPEKTRAEAEEMACRRIWACYESVASGNYLDAAKFAKLKRDTLFPIILTRVKACLDRMVTERQNHIKKTIPNPNADSDDDNCPAPASGRGSTNLQHYRKHHPPSTGYHN